MKSRGGLGIMLLAALVSAAGFGALLTCTPGWNDPHALKPEPGLPCGRVYHLCPAGGCCGADEACGEQGHACGFEDCCFIGSGVMAKRKHAQTPPGELVEGGRP